MLIYGGVAPAEVSKLGFAIPIIDKLKAYPDESREVIGIVNYSFAAVQAETY